jgi:hypothetical protein
LIGRQAGIALGHAVLHFLDDAAEFDQGAVAGPLDDPRRPPESPRFSASRPCRSPVAGLQYHNGSELVKAAGYGWLGKLPERPKWVRSWAVDEPTP